MAKTAKEKNLEKQYAEAKAKQAGEIAQAQIEVYEGQTYEAKSAYQEAKSKRGTARSKLPEEIPTDPYYKERLLEAQYIKANISSPEHSEEHKHVDSYTAEIKKQQKAKETIQVLDKQMPQLYASAVAESEAVETKAEKAKVAETKKQEELITGFQTAIVTEQKAEAKRVADEKARLDAEAQVREDAYQLEMKGAGSGKNKYVGKSIHYGSVGVALGKGDIIISSSRAGLGVSFHESYYKRALASYQSRGGMYTHMTLADVKTISRAGMVSQSGKARDQVFRGILDKTGGLEADYQASRAQAKKNVASAYGSMSAKEKLSSSAMASTYATSPEIKKADQLTALSDMTGGLLGTKSYKVSKGDTMKVYEKDGTDVTAQVMPIIIKQREIELSNRRQQEYVKELRAGNIGIATALTNPQTTQSYKGTSTVNLGTFLKERGLTAKTAPDSMFKPDYSEKLEKARAQAKTSGDMGDLRLADKGFIGKTNQPYQMSRADSNEINQRKLAQQRVAAFDPKPIDSFFAKDSSYVPSVGTVTLTKNELLTKKETDVWGFDPIANQVNKDMGTTWTVTVQKKGVEYTSDFKTREEAVLFKKSQEKVFSGTDNDLWNKYNYAPAVDSGEVIHPSKTETWSDDIRLGAGYVITPSYNILKTVYNLTQPEDKQVPMLATAEDKLIGGTITDVMSGTPLKGTGVTGFADYVVENPFRAVAEIPSAVVTGFMGGKAITYGVKGVSYGVSTTAKLGNKIIQGNAPTIVKVPTMAMMGTGQAIQRTGAKVSAIPSRIGSSVYAYGTIPTGTKYGMPSFTIPQQVVRQGIVKPYDTATMFQGSRVGFGAKANFIMTPSGRMFVRQSTDIAGEIGAKPQFLNKQVAMFENENVVGFATRGKMKTTQYDMPKETPFKSDVFEPTKKTELVLKNQPKEKKPFPELYDSKATTSGKPFPDDLVKVEDIGKRSIPKLQTPTVLDRIKSTTLYKTKVSTKQYKTNIDEVTFYSDTTGDLVKGVKRPKAELQGEGVNYRGFEKPEITGTRTRLQDYKTSTSESTIKGQLKYSEVAGGKIKFKGSPVRQVDTIVTGAKLTGKKNLKLIDDMVEEEQIEEVGKKTVMKGTDYFGGGKKAGQLKQSLESRNPTTYEAQSGKIKPKDETILYGVSKGKIPVDKKAFAQTMKESNLLREMADKAPLNKKPTVPKGVDEPPKEKYHAFIGESKSTGKTFQGTRVELGSGIGTTGVGSSFTKTNVDLGKGGGISNIKDVKGMSSKPDVVGVTTNRINVKKFEEPKIQKGDKIVDSKEGSTVQRTKLDTFQETKIKLGQSAVAKPAQIQVPKVKASVKPPKVSPKIKQIITPTVSQKTGTGLVQETAQLTKQKTKQQPKIKQAQRLRAVQSQSAITAVVAKTAQVQAVAQMKLPTIQKTTKRKGAGTLFYDTPNPQIEKRKRKRGKKAGFIGNVRLDNVVGMYKRKEITYGQKKVTKLERQDMRLTAGTKNRIALPSSGLLKTKKKKKSMFGKKSKDEFAGFESKSKKKTTKRKKSKSTKIKLM
uniref:ORF51 n=1 Tax=Nitrosopumilaceae spindle-shaped virus TaxID=3065433 RepID=A0AAT9JAD7_9VIRU